MTGAGAVCAGVASEVLVIGFCPVEESPSVLSGLASVVRYTAVRVVAL